MSSSTVKKNIIASFAGKAWTTAMALAFIPLYIRLMGIEAYGLIGIFASLTALLSILDMGLSSTLSRELARLSASREADQESRDLVRTLELIYWGVGVLIGLGLIAIAPVIARQWIQPQGIPIGTVERALMIMGLVVAIQWPASLYAGGLMGLQRQVLLNGIRGGMATIQHGGAVLALLFISPSILSYFAWQIIVSMVNILFLACSLWKSLPMTAQKAAFQKSLLQKNWKFAAGMTGISVMVTLLTQLDKVILSKLLTLALFGYYALAVTIANNLAQLVGPIFSALFPRFSQLIAQRSDADIPSLYHKACQLVSIIVLPAAGILAFFSKEILTLWIHDPITVRHTWPLLSLLVIGSALNALMTLPYTMQLAYGWTRLSFLKNTVAIILLVPLMIWLVDRYGALGAAITWLVLNAGYVLIEIPIMHRRLLRNEMRSWYAYDVGTPLFVVFVIGLASRLLMPQFGAPSSVLFWLIVTGLMTTAFSSVAMPFSREWLKRSIFA